MNKFKMIVTIYPDAGDNTKPDEAFSTVGRAFAAKLADGPVFTGAVVRADIDNNQMVNLYVEGEM